MSAGDDQKRQGEGGKGSGREMCQGEIQEGEAWLGKVQEREVQGGDVQVYSVSVCSD